MAGQDFGELSPNSHGGIKGLHGILIYHGNSIAPEFIEFGSRPTDEFIALEMDTSTHDLTIGTEKTDQSIGNCTLAAS
jgi:hypothetical protein